MINTQNTIPASEQNEAEARKKGISRSIIIGLGGTGHDIVLDVRKRLIEKYSSLDKIPIVTFIVIDTDQSIKSDRAGLSDDPTANKAINLDPADKIHTPVGGTDALLKELPSYPHLKSWIDPSAISGDIQLGAGAIRARGRLAFFWNYNEISRKIEEKYNQVKLKASVDTTQRNGLTLGEGITVYLVGSLMGGTGSGMFLDAAYTVRKRMPEAQIIGIFTIPPAAGAVSVDNRANAYAALLELNHYSDNSTIFTAQYQKDQTPLSEDVGSKSPFTFCYLEDTHGPQTHLDVGQLTGMVGNSIFLDLTSEFQRQKKSNRDNYSSFLIERDALGCPQSFVSFGLSSLYFPKDKIRIACANRMAKTIVEQWMTPIDRSTNIPSFAAQEWLKLGLETEHVKQKVLHWEDGEGDGTIGDALNAEWSGLGQRYANDYPGHKEVAPMFVAHDNDLTERLRDNDPNPDVLAKLPRNLGEYVRGMQRNLAAQLPEKKLALSKWVAQIVEQPAHRHGVVRDVLIQWGDTIAREVKEIENRAKATRELTTGDADRKNASSQKITEFAGDFSLGMVPGAKKKAIDEQRETYLGLARGAHLHMVDERITDYLLKFYDEIQKHLNLLTGELDSYITQIRGLRDEFASQEEQAIATETKINGEVIFDAGSARRDEAGRTIYEGGDIAFYFGKFAGDPETFNKVQNEIRADLRLSETIYALKDLNNRKIVPEMIKRCERVFTGLDNESVLERFYRLCKDSPEVAEGKFQTVWAAAQPFVKISENDANWKFKDQSKCKPTVVGMMHGSAAQTEAETNFLAMMQDQITGLDSQNITNNAEQHQALFIRERAAFPLRLLTGLDNYKYVYDQHINNSLTAMPVHTRADVNQWIRIHPPTIAAQWDAWETFVIGWASGVIEEKRTRQSTVTGATEVVSYQIAYKDNFGFPKTDEIGEWRALNEWDATQMTFGGKKKLDISRPPLEALDLVLTLCDKKTLLEQIKRAITIKRREIGDVAFAHSLLAHAHRQLAAELPFYELYYLTLVGDQNASPPIAGYLAKAGLTEAINQPLETGGETSQTAGAAVVTDAIISTPQPVINTSNGISSSPIPLGPSQVPPALPAAAPPAIAAAPSWFYASGTQQNGPYDMSVMRALVTAQVVTPQTQVWCAGMSGWQAAASTELASLFGASAPGAMPPPLL